ncbi:hypothetical protein Lal_00033923 [Lupinus albus]|nr:hypothetical protein Lal_00033923 [Lupinus albus]
MSFALCDISRSAQNRYLPEITHVADKHYVCPYASNMMIPLTSFDNRDYEGTVRGHDDPLIITRGLNNNKIKRLFISQGNTSEIMFWDPFEKLELQDQDLLPYDGQLVSFTGEGITQKGYVEFLVID